MWKRNQYAQKDGFEEQGGYFNAKLSKLDNQFNKSTDIEVVDSIFSGISIYINGLTDPPEPVLRSLFIKHGGTIHTYLVTKTNYVIALNLPEVKIKLLASKTLSPKWIIDSIAAGKRLQVYKYFLYRGQNKSINFGGESSKPKDIESTTTTTVDLTKEHTTTIVDDQLLLQTKNPQTSNSNSKINSSTSDTDTDTDNKVTEVPRPIYWRDFDKPFSKQKPPPPGWELPSVRAAKEKESNNQETNNSNSNYPALNGVSEVNEIRDLIRSIIAQYPEPSPQDILPLKEFFLVTFNHGFTTNCHRLLRFIHRKSLEGCTSPLWKNALEEIIHEIQIKCQEKYDGTFDLGDIK